MLLLKQICPVCKLWLRADLEEFHPDLGHRPATELEIHHKTPLSGIDNIQTRKRLDHIKNMELLHKECHRLITYNKE